MANDNGEKKLLTAADLLATTRSVDPALVRTVDDVVNTYNKLEPNTRLQPEQSKKLDLLLRLIKGVMRL